MKRHFTVSGFVSQSGETALHWHRLGMWLPPGGHVEPDEDPVAAVLREVNEETGFSVEVVPTTPLYAWAHPQQLPSPATVGVYDIPHGDAHVQAPHQHIDFVYFTRPLPGQARELPAGTEGWRWVSEDLLRADAPVARPDGEGAAAITDDVRMLALDAIAAVRALEVGMV